MKIKATTANTDPTTVTVGTGTAATSQIQADLQAAIAELEQFKAENEQWMSTEHLVEMGRIETMLKAEEVAYRGGNIPAGSTTDSTAAPQDLDPLWNGIPASFINKDDNDTQKLADTELYGEYQGTVVIPGSGDPTQPTKAAFQMTDDMNALYAESRGRDIIITAEYMDGTRKSWVVKDGTMRSEPIVISARGLSHGVTIDTKKVVRLNNGSPSTAAGFYIWGSDSDDTIYGTQSSDKIAGMGGSDKIYGGGGDNTIYGDGYYGPNSTAGDMDPTSGGDDYIDAGPGHNIVYGGGGKDTAVDNGHESISTDVETLTKATAAKVPSSDFITASADWDVSQVAKDGTIEVKNTTGKGGSIDIDMPDGYTMAYASMDPNDSSLIITFVGDNGSFSVRIEKFFSGAFGDTPQDAIAKLNFRGSADADIIDFSRINHLTSQVINIDGGGGDDVILGAKNNLVSDGVDLDTLTSSQGNSDGVLASYVKDGVFATPTNYSDDDGNTATYGGYQAKQVGNVIEISAEPGKTPQATLSLLAPDGYTKAYVTQGQDGFTCVVFVRPDPNGGRADTIVFKIDPGLKLDLSNINAEYNTLSGSGKGYDIHQIDLVPISSDGSDYLLDGGDGTDFVFAQKGSRVKND
ncbi:MAG: hypothetical protein V2A66_10930, partial [Pseudomonadota bacterium]